MFNIGLQYAWRNILRTPLRSFFTLFSVAMIMSLYTIIDGVGEAFTKQITSLLGRHNADIIVQSKYSVSPLSSRIPDTIAHDISHDASVYDYGALAIGKLHIRKNAEGFLIGVESIEKFAHRLGLSIVAGRLSGETANEVIVAKPLAVVLNVGVGDTLELAEDKYYRVVGLYETWIGFFNSSLISTMSEAQTLLHIKDHISMLALALKKPYRRQEIIQKINTKYPKLKAIQSSEFSNSVGPLKALFMIMHVISIVTLIIASAIVLNTFVMAISERSKEIGILLAIGWSRSMIVFMLTIESVMLSLLGGVIGFLISLPILHFLKEHYQGISVYMPTSLGSNALLQVMTLCFAIGVVSVLFPAFYGMKKNIARALHEK